VIGSRTVEVVCGLIGVAMLGVVIAAGYLGSGSALDNFAPTFILINFWVGMVFVSILFGDVFRAFNPWRAVGRAAGWVARRAGGESLPEPLAYPARLGRWPAALGVLAFAWVELVWVDRDDPSKLAVLALVYAAVQLVGMSLYGERTWSDRADAFGVYFGLFARLAPLHWRDGGVYARPPLAGAPPLTPVAGTVALLCVMIGSTSFDGFSQ
jgi:hypothetical protein